MGRAVTIALWRADNKPPLEVVVANLDIRDHVARLTEDSDREYKVKYVFTVPVLSRLLRRVVDPMYAYTTSKYKMMGDVSLGRCILVKLCEASA